MKTVNIIEELTKFSYDAYDGVIHVDKDEIILKAFEEKIGHQPDNDDNGIDIVYAPKPMTNTGGERGRDFLYIYAFRFPGRDADIFAILKDGDGELVYIYEIE